MTEIHKHKPSDATHFRVLKVDRYKQAHYYKRLGEKWLWYSFAGEWVESALTALELNNMKEVPHD